MSVQIIDTLKPKNNGSFPVVEAVDIEVREGLRLPEALNQKAEQTDLEELSSALTEKADQSDLTALTTVVNGKANTSDVATTTANLQAQIDEIAQTTGTGTADTEIAQARVGLDGEVYSSLKSRIDTEIGNIESTINNIENGNDVTIAGYYDNLGDSVGNNIYKSNKVNIPAQSLVETLRFYSLNDSTTTSMILFVLDTNDKIIDKFDIASFSAGWNTITLNKTYPVSARIAISGGKIRFSYATSAQSSYFSNGLFECSNTYRTSGIGDTLSFTQNQPTRYYEFSVEIKYHFNGIADVLAVVDDKISAEVAEFNDRFEKIENGSDDAIITYYDNLGDGVGNNIYKSDYIAIPSGSLVSDMKFYSTAAFSGTSAIFFVLDDNDEIIDRYESTDYSQGWNTISVNKIYAVDAKIAISGGKIRYSYSDGTQSVYFSDGLYECANTDRTSGIGDTLSFTHNVSGRYYEFSVEIHLHTSGLSDIAEIKSDIMDLANQVNSLEPLASNSDFTMPKVRKTGESGYTLIGKWYKLDNTFTECCNTSGASIIFKVKNATTVTANIKQVINPSHQDWAMAVEPYIAYSIDGSTFTRVQTDSTSDEGITITIPSTDEHLVWIVVDGMCLTSGAANRDSGWSAVYIDSITSDGDMFKIAPATKQILFVGDSIVEGINTLGITSTSEVNSAVNEFSFRTARKLNSIPILQGYGGSTAKIGLRRERYSIPDAQRDTFNVENTPDIILIEYGYNDSAAQTAQEFIQYYNELIDLLLGHYTGVPIVCLIPFHQSFASEIRSIASSRNYCYVVETADYNPSYSDNSHPDAAGAETIAVKLSADIENILSKNYFL